MLEHDTRVITAYEDLRRAFYNLDEAAHAYRKVRGYWSDHFSSIDRVPVISQRDWADWLQRIEAYEAAASVVEEYAWKLSAALLAQAARVEDAHDL
jgi:hypothetical protein